MLRILTGLLTIQAVILSVVMTITFYVMCYADFLFTDITFDMSLSYYVALLTAISSVILYSIFVWLCKKEKKKVRFGTLFKELAELFKAISVMDSIYLKQSEQKTAEDIQVKVTELSDLIAEKTGTEQDS